ncbi:hypothetical protein BDFG_04273 [Blastomyces dermatitidis ATCC 26199]|nr:hypothetical protein BDFG_04273 [Blastomyces dermatitidis ATCC 26199]
MASRLGSDNGHKNTGSHSRTKDLNLNKVYIYVRHIAVAFKNSVNRIWAVPAWRVLGGWVYYKYPSPRIDNGCLLLNESRNTNRLDPISLTSVPTNSGNMLLSTVFLKYGKEGKRGRKTIEARQQQRLVAAKLCREINSHEHLCIGTLYESQWPEEIPGSKSTFPIIISNISALT